MNIVLIIIFINYYITVYKGLNLKNYLLQLNIINLNLINGLVLIHPVFIYISYLILILLMIKTNNKKLNKLIWNLKKGNKLIYPFLALFLGSY